MARMLETLETDSWVAAWLYMLRASWKYTLTVVLAFSRLRTVKLVKLTLAACRTATVSGLWATAFEFASRTLAKAGS